MKSANIYYTAIALFFIFLLALPVPGQSQDKDQTPAFTKEQLAQMLAPIALYPDALLSQVLMASTYPLEVVEADRWVRKNPGLTGDSLDEALQDMDWDPSVKSLCHFPKVLGLMSEKIAETSSLGNAFLAQEDDVMAMIQELRTAAYKQGNLATNPEQKVVVEKETIVIEPANPDIIYVPYYNPLYVYGPWWYPNFPPYYWGPDLTIVGTGISFWPSPFFGFAIGSWSYFDWHRHAIIINPHKRPRFYRPGEWRAKPGPWRHAPRHRRGVAYRDKSTARKFGKAPRAFRTNRPDIRGFPERSGTGRRGRVHLPSTVGRNTRRQGHRIVTEHAGQATKSPPSTVGRNTPRQGPPIVTEHARQGGARFGRRQQAQERIERGGVGRRGFTEGRAPDIVFGRTDDGRAERSYSRRGRWSREGQQRFNRGAGPAAGAGNIEGPFNRGRGRMRR